MQKQLEKIESELAQRIYKLFMEKFDGNKSAFARASECKETTIRRILRNEQGITINLLFRLANALQIPVNELLKDLSIKKED
jgi:plasmid maintenance system antidote protein VapI